ncbi:tumor necrosis factor ligand superfamily member 13 isoform X2 [Hemibagrus wyckioides]|uniref:tumor necrosis factor ligand superfamily member 13 isoform X2 n=1 Tax=Hemibagrus wyckioides TaxID=337641 RepID=UPI00266B8D3B|nr:tumor necrosis factor ligand superfamily member 13 isoform X2 [Hemibagrus wyckioides]
MPLFECLRWQHAQLCDGGAMLKWSVLVYVVGVMVALLHLHYTHRRMLTELQSVRSECSNLHCYYCCPGTSLSLACGSSRGKRDVSSQRKPRRKRQKHGMFLHLVPASTYSYDDRDTTVLSWAVGRSQGAGLQVSGDSITVVTEGLYFIYSQVSAICSVDYLQRRVQNSFLVPVLQVLYEDSATLMGHVITKRHKGAETKLMKCMTIMSPNVSKPLNTCYTAGIHFLESGSVLELSVPRAPAKLVLSAPATFMGIYSL